MGQKNISFLLPSGQTLTSACRSLHRLFFYLIPSYSLSNQLCLTSLQSDFFNLIFKSLLPSPKCELSMGVGPLSHLSHLLSSIPWGWRDGSFCTALAEDQNFDTPAPSEETSSSGPQWALHSSTRTHTLLRDTRHILGNPASSLAKVH